MGSKVFKGVDFDEKGNIVATADKFKYVTPVATAPSPPHKFFEPRGYRSDQLDLMNADEFEHLTKWVAREAYRRELVAKQKLLHNGAAYEQLSNFLAGCVQAMACRAALRWGKGHRPFSPDGKGPGSKAVSGEMWNIFDVAALGKRLLITSGSEVRAKDGKEYIVNAQPMLWDMTNKAKELGLGSSHLNDATRWLMMGSGTWSFPQGTKFCAYRNVGGVAAQPV